MKRPSTSKFCGKTALLSLAAALAFPAGASAQISYGGIPASFGMKAGHDVSVKRVKAPFKNIRRQIARDMKATQEEAALPKVGENIHVGYDIRKDGTWTVMPDGSSIWRLRIESPDAPALILAYDDFFVPEGAQLYLYNDNHSQVLGAYTYNTHPQGGPFSTEMTFGDAVTLELVVPAGRDDIKEKARIKVSSVAYCYNHLRMPSKKGIMKVGESSDCMINVNASEGKDWQTEKDGVVRLLMYFDDGIYVCSGTMVNNTAKDLTPYLLTAYHCYVGGTEPNLAKWQFYFHYESPDANNSEPLNAKTIVGCSRKCFTPIEDGSDGMLIELSEQVPEEWNVYFNGWDRRNEPVEGRGVCIHHPAGDIKKISTFDRYETSRWTGQGGPSADGAHWAVKFVQTDNGWSQVEGGSSGSPLFASHHLVVGTLTGGGGGCSNKTGTNYYGKLWYHWNQYGEGAENQMSHWLDPLGTGAETLEGLYYNPEAARMTIDKETLTLDGKVGQENPDEFLDIKGYNLTQSIEASVEGMFELSTDEKTWSKAVAVDKSGGRLYVRYVPTIIGNHTGMLTIKSPEVKRVRNVSLTASSCNDIHITEVLPNGEVGEKYEAYLNPTGSEGPYEFRIEEGNLPEGLSMSKDGHISGTIAKDGNYRLLVSVTDKYGCVTTAYTNIYVKCMVVARFPYVEDFENGLEADCWKQTVVKGDAAWTLGAGVGDEYEDVTTAQSGSHNVIFNDKAYNENTTLLVSPQLDLTGYASAKLSFYRLMPAWDDDYDELKLYYRTSAHGEWQPLATYTEDTPEWTLTEAELPETSGEYFIAFGATGGYGHGIGIDNISVDYGTPTSIENLDADSTLKMCCTTSADQLTVEWNGNVSSLAVFDSLGRLLYNADTAQGASSQTVPTDGWTGGAYVVVAETPSGKYKQKVLINKQ